MRFTRLIPHLKVLLLILLLPALLGLQSRSGLLPAAAATGRDALVTAARLWASWAPEWRRERRFELALTERVQRPTGKPAPDAAAGPPAEVAFMRRFIVQVNPSLRIEDAGCVRGLSEAIHAQAETHALEWQRLFALAWQESSFDCHAKNRADPGGAYGPFQIRRLWEPVTGDPRRRYFDPELAVARVVEVFKYYQSTERLQRLIERRFRNPLLCLYNTGESQRVNMRYCRQIGRKLELVQEAWRAYREEDIASAGERARARSG